MKHLLSVFFLAFVAATSLLLAACKKDPAPTTGTVIGQISPANSITAVTATSSTTPPTTATATPNGSGAYSFPNLAPGTYTLSFAPASGYATPASQSVAVTAGGTATAARVTATTGSSAATSLSYTVNGAPVSADLVEGINQLGFLYITGGNPQGTRSIFLKTNPAPTGARTYTFGGPGSTSEIILAEGLGANRHYWDTGFPGGSGTITITSVVVSPTRRQASGTFSCVATANNTLTTGTRTVTAGSFHNVDF
jgi:hypothetical protein